MQLTYSKTSIESNCLTRFERHSVGEARRGRRKLPNSGHRSGQGPKSRPLFAVAICIAAARWFHFSMPKGQLPRRERFAPLLYITFYITFITFNVTFMLTLCAY
jgi:hypothetical protein